MNRFSLSSLLLATALSTPVWAQDTAGVNTISRVQVKSGVVEITGTQKPSFSTFPMTDPPRLVVDIAQAVFSGVPETIDVASGHVVAIKTASYGTDASAIARVVIGFDRDVEPDIQTVGNKLVVRSTLAPGSAVLAQAAPTAAPPAAKVSEDAAAAAAAQAAADKQRQDAAAAAAAQAAAYKQRQDGAAAAAAQAAADKQRQDAAAAAAAQAAADKQRQDAAAAAAAQAAADKQRQDAAAAAAAQAAADQQRQDAAAAAAAAAGAETQRQNAAAASAAAAEKRRLDELAAATAAEEQRRREDAAAAAAAEEKRRQETAAAAAAEEQRRQQEALAAKTQQEKEFAAAQAAAAEDKRKQEAALAAAAAESQRKEQAAAAAAAAEEKRRQDAAATAAAEEGRSAAAAQAAEQRRQQDLKLQAAAETRAKEDQLAVATPAASHPSPSTVSVEGSATSGGSESSSKRKSLTFVGFDEKGPRVYVRTNGPVRYSVSTGAKNTVVVELDNTAILVSNNARALDTAFFAGPVLRIQPERGPKNSVRVAITLRDAVAFEAHQDGNEVSVQFRAP